jgi:hypothetical protein
MFVKQDMDFNDLLRECWSGAKDTVKAIDDAGKGDELMSVLEEIFSEEIPTLTQINDLLWFEPETVYEWLGMSEEDEEDEEDYE